MEHLLEVSNLVTEFNSDMGHSVALDHIGFSIDRGEILGIVGESGCGKSVTSLSIMRLLPSSGKVTSGSIQFDGCELTALTDKELDKIRGNELTMVFQDALASLNPVFTIGNQLTESIKTHTPLRGRDAKAHALEMLKKVGLPEPETVMKKYPHTLSGGMRQRVMIAMALCCNAKLVIADEPTTALDVTIQAQIMKLLKQLRDESGTAVMLITHDIGLIAQMADRVQVMYAGQIVESGPVQEIFAHPSHPYTKALMDSVPDITDSKNRVLKSIPGSVPADYGFITGCRFAGRCPYESEECSNKQEMLPVGKTGQHSARCFRAAEIHDKEDC